MSIRRRLTAVSLLGVAVCVGSILAVREMGATLRARLLERAEEEITREVDRLARPAEPLWSAGLVHESASCRSGRLLSGYLDPGADATAHLDRLHHVVRNAVEQAARVVRASGDDVRVFRVNVAGRPTLVAVRPAASEEVRTVWATLDVMDPPGLRAWKLVGIGFALVVVTLIGLSVHTIASVQRGAGSLRRSLGALASDLDATVPRPALREFAEVADGVAELARKLAGAERERDRLLRELADRERLAALGRVAAGVAHEVRNPLAAIKLRVDLATRQGSSPELFARDLDDIGQEIQRLDRLVGDLLLFSGRAVVPRDEHDLGALARTRAALLDPWAAERGVALAVDGEARALLDPDSIARVIDNLVRNAIEASLPGGVVRLQVAKQAGATTLSVIDEGPGVSPEREGELFEPFFTTRPEGTGLGLALSRAVAIAHGGVLRYERREGRTCFCLELPDAARAAAG